MFYFVADVGKVDWVKSGVCKKIWQVPWSKLLSAQGKSVYVEYYTIIKWTVVIVTVQRIQLGPPDVFLPITKASSEQKNWGCGCFGPITIGVNFNYYLVWAGIDARGFAKVNLNAYSW